MMTTVAGLLLALATGNDNSEVELASTLARRGWLDLADELCVRIEALPGARLVRAEVASERARREPDAAAAVRELDRAIARLGTSPTPEERSMAGYLRVQKATVLGESPEVAKAWEDAETYYAASIAALKAMPDGREVEEALLDAMLGLPKAIVGRARLAGAEPQRKALLDRAIALFVEFQFDTGTRPITFEAMLEEGRARADAKDYPRAERCFRSVLALKPKGPAAAAYVSSLRDSAFLNLLRVQTSAGRAKDAVAAADDYLKVPGRARTVMGLAVQMAKAEALAAGGDRPGAILLAQAVAVADPNGSISLLARDRIREWTRDGSATAAQMMLIADGLMDRGLYREALVDLRACVEACKGAGDLATHEPVASFKRGECFRALKREAEASLAFQDVFRKYPKHELAERAAFEAVRALIRSAASTRDRRDEEQQEALLREIEARGVQGRFADFFVYLRAEILERRGSWKAAADLYRKVGESCEVYDEALVSAAHCLRRDVEAGGEAAQLQAAETLLHRAMTRLEQSPRPFLEASARWELAVLLLHESVNRPREALPAIARCEALLPADSDLRPRLGELEIRARLGSGDLAGATARLERLLAAPGGGSAALRSVRRVAGALEATDPAKAARTYRTWLDRAATEDAAPRELKAVADGLDRVARELNHVDANTGSVLDLRGKAVENREVWADQAEAFQRLLALGGLIPTERRSAQLLRMSGEGFAASSAADWSRVRKHDEEILNEQQLIGPGGLNGAVLQKQTWLVVVVLDYGHALYQLGKAGQAFQYDNALGIFQDLLNLTQRGSEPWWVARAMQVRVLFDRGQADDLRVAGSLLSTLTVNFPEFDGGKYGIRPLLVELQQQIRAVEGRSR
jgi:tetratricopeptide (TPR) repeat protein